MRRCIRISARSGQLSSACLQFPTEPPLVIPTQLLQFRSDPRGFRCGWRKFPMEWWHIFGDIGESRMGWLPTCLFPRHGQRLWIRGVNENPTERNDVHAIESRKRFQGTHRQLFTRRALSIFSIFIFSSWVTAVISASQLCMHTIIERESSFSRKLQRMRLLAGTQRNH